MGLHHRDHFPGGLQIPATLGTTRQVFSNSRLLFALQDSGHEPGEKVADLPAIAAGRRSWVKGIDVHDFVERSRAGIRSS